VHRPQRIDEFGRAWDDQSVVGRSAICLIDDDVGNPLYKSEIKLFPEVLGTDFNQQFLSLTAIVVGAVKCWKFDLDATSQKRTW